MQVPSPLELIKNTPFSEFALAPTKLTGGFINHVWRLTSTISAKTVILKYASSEMAGCPGEAFSVERMEFEAKGLALLGNLPKALLTTDDELRKVNKLGHDLVRVQDVHVPRLLYYNRNVPFMVLEDIGNLKTYEGWCTANDSSKADSKDIEFVCGAVGKWIAHLHGFGHDNFDALLPHFVNKPARKLLDDMFYGLFCTRIVENTQLPDKQGLADIAKAFVSEKNALVMASSRADRQSNPCTLLFGDLWSGAVLFDKQKHIVNLLDLEFADIGLVYSDVAHFVAHLIPVHFMSNPTYDPNTDPWPSHVVTFLTEYAHTLKKEHPNAFSALVASGSALRLMTVFFGIEVARDVLTGNWCRCGTGNKAKEALMPIECACADTLLQFSRAYIKNTHASIFNVLFSD